jgi:hypothetical protein
MDCPRPDVYRRRVELLSRPASGRAQPPNSIAIPDFTAGAWKSNPRNMDIAFKHGGGNTKVLA